MAHFDLSQVPESVRVAALSPLLWELPITRAMEHFHLSSEALHEARRISVLALPVERIAASQGVVARDRLRRKCIRAECLHPGVLDAVATTSHAVVASKYGFTRATSSKIRGALSAAAAAFKISDLRAAAAVFANSARELRAEGDITLYISRYGCRDNVASGRRGGRASVSSRAKVSDSESAQSSDS